MVSPLPSWNTAIYRQELEKKLRATSCSLVKEREGERETDWAWGVSLVFWKLKVHPQ